MKISLKKKLILSFWALFFVFSLVIGISSFYYSERIVLSNKKDDMADTLNEIDININSLLLQINGFANTLSDNSTVEEFILSESSLPMDDSFAEWISEFTEVFPEISQVYLIDASRNLRYTHTETSQQTVQENLDHILELAEASIQQSLWEGMQPSIEEDNQNTVVMVHKLSYSDTGLTDGYIIVEMNLDSFTSRLMNDHGLLKNQFMMILDQNGEMIAANKVYDTAFLEKILSDYSRGEQNYEVRNDGKTYTVLSQYNGLTGWTSFSVLNQSDFFPEAATLAKSTAYIILLACITAGIVILIYSWHVTEPIANLSSAMKKVETGDFSIQVKSLRNDEMGRLTTSFNFMVERINKLIGQIYQEKIAQKNAEMKALQAQINPHFLYNTLDSINWMLLDLEAYEISDVVVSLGDILRYSIQGNASLVTLKEELDYIESYFCIQKNRLEEKLETEIDVDPCFETILVPKLMLQPIVENAIIHGICSQKESGKVQIKAYVQDETLRIRIFDNGIGMSPEVLKSFQEHVFGSDEVEKHLGIRNVYRRIRILYGEPYGLEIHSKEGNYTEVILILPLEGANEDHNC